jgi:DNA-binding beta-propeller fold protein YncE
LQPEPTPGETATTDSNASEADGHGTVFALLADNRLIAVRTHDGTIVQDHRLAPPPSSSDRLLGHYMARSKDGSYLFVLIASEDTKANLVAVVTLATNTVEATYTLPDDGLIFRSLAVGPVTGQVYLFGNRGKDAVVSTLDPHTGTTVATWTARTSDGYDWLVYQGAISQDERHVFLSYHGEDTSGVDQFEIVDNDLRRCEAPVEPMDSCFGGHGSFILLEDTVVVATGRSVILEKTSTGTIRQAWDTQLVNNHLMEFVVDVNRRRLYAVGSCSYTGGLSSVDLDAGGIPTTSTTPGEWWWSTPPKPPLVRTHKSPCGERLALTPDEVVVAATTSTYAQANRSGKLYLVDAATGNILHTVKTPSEPIDVWSAPGR